VKKPNHESSVSKLIYDPLSVMYVGSTSTNLANLLKIVGAEVLLGNSTQDELKS
jgi:hypothetical protein